MTLEAYVEEQFTTDADLLPFFLDDAGDPRPVEDWWYESSSLGLALNKPVPRRPYIVWNELADQIFQTVRETSDARNRNFQYYVYDEQGTFTKIEQILMVVRRRVKAMDASGPHVTTDGTVLMNALWVGTSGQIPNDGFESGTKFITVAYTVSE